VSDTLIDVILAAIAGIALGLFATIWWLRGR
jgi:hypothetical protein